MSWPDLNRDQGILSLESVQELYKIIEQEPKRATLVSKNLLEVCNRVGSYELHHQLIKTYIRTRSIYVAMMTEIFLY